MYNLLSISVHWNLGHKKIETTMIYSHIVALDANKDVYKLDELFSKKSGQE